MPPIMPINILPRSRFRMHVDQVEQRHRLRRINLPFEIEQNPPILHSSVNAFVLDQLGPNVWQPIPEECQIDDESLAEMVDVGAAEEAIDSLKNFAGAFSQGDDMFDKGSAMFDEMLSLLPRDTDIFGIKEFTPLEIPDVEDVEVLADVEEAERLIAVPASIKEAVLTEDKCSRILRDWLQNPNSKTFSNVAEIDDDFDAETSISTLLDACPDRFKKRERLIDLDKPPELPTVAFPSVYSMEPYAIRSETRAEYFESIVTLCSDLAVDVVHWKETKSMENANRKSSSKVAKIVESSSKPISTTDDKTVSLIHLETSSAQDICSDTCERSTLESPVWQCSTDKDEIMEADIVHWKEADSMENANLKSSPKVAPAKIVESPSNPIVSTEDKTVDLMRLEASPVQDIRSDSDKKSTLASPLWPRSTTEDEIMEALMSKSFDNSFPADEESSTILSENSNENTIELIDALVEKIIDNPEVSPVVSLKNLSCAARNVGQNFAVSGAKETDECVSHYFSKRPGKRLKFAGFSKGENETGKENSTYLNTDAPSFKRVPEKPNEIDNFRGPTFNPFLGSSSTFQNNSGVISGKVSDKRSVSPENDEQNWKFSQLSGWNLSLAEKQPRPGHKGDSFSPVDKVGPDVNMSESKKKKKKKKKGVVTKKPVNLDSLNFF